MCKKRDVQKEIQQILILQKQKLISQYHHSCFKYRAELITFAMFLMPSNQDEGDDFSNAVSAEFW